MQNSTKLKSIIQQYSDEKNYLFSIESLSVVFPELSEANINQLLSRANKGGILERVCKGIYINPNVKYDSGSVLFSVAQALRFPECMYVSLETVLSSLSVISQQMMGYVTIITSGRSGIIDCGRFGKIEFVHSDNVELVHENVRFDIQTGMYWATENQALSDMKKHRRKLLSLVEDK